MSSFAAAIKRPTLPFGTGIGVIMRRPRRVLGGFS
jgi:hypothetical protein